MRNMGRGGGRGIGYFLVGCLLCERGFRVLLRYESVISLEVLRFLLGDICWAQQVC